MQYYTDGGTQNNGDFGHQKSVICGTNDKGEELFLIKVGDKTNNEAELMAVLMLLSKVDGNIEINSDSKLVVGLLSGKFHTKIDRLRKLVTAIKKLNKPFSIKWIPREINLAGFIIDDRYGL